MVNFSLRRSKWLFFISSATPVADIKVGKQRDVANYINIIMSHENW